MSSANTFAVAVLALVLPAGAARADGPPRLEVTASCEAAARGALSAGRDRAACLADEHAAEAVVVKNWPKYDADNKTQCVGNVTTGGPASYVELLSCLEVMRDAKEMRAADDGAPERSVAARPKPAGRPGSK